MEEKVTIEEMNRVIAEFMGYTDFYQVALGWRGNINGEDGQNEFIKDYHQDFSELIYVVEKIWKMNKMFSLNLFTEGGGIVNCKIYNWELGAPYQETESKSIIDSIYQCVYDFIQYHNTLNQNQ